MGPERRQVTPRSGRASVGVTSLKERALAPQQKVKAELGSCAGGGTSDGVRPLVRPDGS